MSYAGQPREPPLRGEPLGVVWNIHLSCQNLEMRYKNTQFAVLPFLFLFAVAVEEGAGVLILAMLDWGGWAVLG